MFTNSFKTGMLIFGLVALFGYVGGLIGDQQGTLIGLLIAAAISFYSYWFSDKSVIKAYHCREVNERDNPRLYNTVKILAQRAGLPMPKVYIVPEQQPNAFATGRNPEHAAVACTEGLLKIMDDNELAGVLGHELGHVKHRDILISTIAATFAGAITNLTRIFHSSGARKSSYYGETGRGGNIFVVILVPIIAVIMQMAISRKREFMADAAGAEFSGNPLYLSHALEKLEEYSRKIPLVNNSKPATAHMFIVNPFAGLKGFQHLFKTHPATAARVRELEKMAKNQGR